jgi:subtilisin family serine protease
MRGIFSENFKLYKAFPWLLLCAFILTLLVPNSSVGSGTDPIALRIPHGSEYQRSGLPITPQRAIEYDSFEWILVNPSDLPALDNSGMDYQVIENPYQLTLSGQSFDPLFSEPNISPGWEGNSEETGPGLHLIQFHGPIKLDWADALTAEGLSILQYIHPYTYVVWGTPDLVKITAENEFVRWTGDYFPAYTIQPQNQILGSEPIRFRAMSLPQAGLEETIAALETLGASQVSSTSGVDPAFDLVSFILPGDRVQEAASLPGVYSIQPVPTDGGDRGELSNQVNADNVDISNRAMPGYWSWLNQLGLSGAGVVIANVDSGVDETHPDLVSRMLSCTGISCGDSTTVSNHGTHTAGIMAGDGASGVQDASGFLRGLGMAPGANLLEQIYNPFYQQENGMLTLMTDSYRNGAVISGNSWGPASTPQGYDLDTRLVDIGVRDADPITPKNQALTYVLSIMNGYGGTSTQGSPDEAKNTFTIGSTYMQSTSGYQYLNINDLSPNTAHGPALDGRIIPHMVAPGCYVDSTYSGGGHGLMCGTSMASPHVSGAAALFFELYREKYGVDPSPALVKAAFLPVAHDLADSKDADGIILGHPFDAKQGWGRLDANAALDPDQSVVYYDQVRIFNNSGQFWTETLTTETPIKELRAMLVWTDAPGHGLGGTTPAWVNDLDLSISFNGQAYYGNNFGLDGFSVPGGSPDIKNNTEGIFLRDLNTNSLTITVTAANIAGDGIPNHGNERDQDFSLVIYYSQGESTYNEFIPLIFR